jgi:hypothetical protein
MCFTIEQEQCTLYQMNHAGNSYGQRACLVYARASHTKFLVQLTFCVGFRHPQIGKYWQKNQQHRTDWALASEFFGGQPCNSRWAQACELSGKVNTGSKPKRALKLFTIKHDEQI